MVRRKQNGLPIVLAAFALTGAPMSVSTMLTPAIAQNGGDQTPPSGFICLAWTSTGSDGVAHTTRVMVPQAEEAKLTGRGFVRSSCGKAVSWMRTTGPSMCGLADLNDPAFISQFMTSHGLTPAEICTLSAQLPGGV